MAKKKAEKPRLIRTTKGRAATAHGELRVDGKVYAKDFVLTDDNAAAAMADALKRTLAPSASMGVESHLPQLNNRYVLRVTDPLLRPGLSIETSVSEKYVVPASTLLVRLVREINGTR